MGLSVKEIMESAGYSKTPLAKKLGIKDGFSIMLVGEPGNYFDLFSDLPRDLSFHGFSSEKKNLIHYFTKKADDLERDIVLLRNEIYANGIIWISWPKKASKVATDVNEDLIRKLALSHGLVDVKVCAVDDVWSGLKLVIPLKLR